MYGGLETEAVAVNGDAGCRPPTGGRTPSLRLIRTGEWMKKPALAALSWPRVAARLRQWVRSSDPPFV